MIANPRRIVLGALGFSVSGILALLLALSLFAYPSADDFCLAVRASQLGFREAQGYWYNNWTGRFFSTAVISAFVAGRDIVGIYWLAAILVLLLTLASFVILVWSIAHERHSWLRILLASAIATVLFVAITPDPAQTFYWLTGSYIYQLGNVCFVVLVALLIWRETGASAKSNPLVLIAASLAAVAAIGSNEVSLLLTLITLSAGTLVVFRTRRPSRYGWAALLAVALVAALVSVMAPGNAIRAASMEGDGQLRPDPWVAALAFLPWTALRVLYWLSGIGTWASALILLWTTVPSSRKLLYSNGKFDKRFLAVPIAWVALMFLLSLIGFVINRYPLPERAESVVALVFLLGWFPSFIVLAHYLLGDRLVAADDRRVAIAGALLFIGLLGSPNIFEAYKDVYRGYRFDVEMRERFKMLRAKQGHLASEVVVASISRPPRTLFATDFVTDPRDIRNACAAEYFGVKSITLGAPAK